MYAVVNGSDFRTDGCYFLTTSTDTDAAVTILDMNPPVGTVSVKTKLLVLDGLIGGNQDKNTKELGVRTVHPDMFRKLLEFVKTKLVEK